MDLFWFCLWEVQTDTTLYAKSSEKHMFVEGAFHPLKNIQIFTWIFAKLSAKSGKQVYFPSLLIYL